MLNIYVADSHAENLRVMETFSLINPLLNCEKKILAFSCNPEKKPTSAIGDAVCCGVFMCSVFCDVSLVFHPGFARRYALISIFFVASTPFVVLHLARCSPILDFDIL